MFSCRPTSHVTTALKSACHSAAPEDPLGNPWGFEEHSLKITGLGWLQFHPSC